MTDSSPVRIGRRLIGQGHPVYLVAELSANHGGSLDAAKDLVRAASESGADAIKLQTYTADTITLDCDAPPFVVQGDLPWKGRTLHDLYEEAHTPWAWHAPLRELAESLGMDCFSTPFDPTAVVFLEELGMPAYKVASFEIVDIPLLKLIAATGKPVIMSTGMAELAEIEEAVSALREDGCKELVLLKCTSAYPAPPGEMNLRALADLSSRFNVPAGLSDHSLGIAAAVASVALGACMIEKHICLSREQGGPDAAFSLEPREFKQIAEAVRVVEQALGGVTSGPTEKDRPALAYRRSLFVVKDVRQGERFTSENIRSIRPAAGLHPRYYDRVIARGIANRDLKKGTPLSWDLIDGVDE